MDKMVAVVSRLTSRGWPAEYRHIGLIAPVNTVAACFVSASAGPFYTSS